ncbi:MAG: class I SAM-dependent methyltransferase [Actinobacteria bacterium]|nr:class I SAM-dependent methyltransferase [Actinomycetota bacterium]
MTETDALKLFSFQLFSKLEGAVTAGMVHLGDQLGLYVAMNKAGRPVTTHEIAATTGLSERWVREWAQNQAAAKLITSSFDENDGERRFGLTPEAAAVLATPSHPYYGMGMFHRLPQTMNALEHVRESFHTGVGHDYDSHGPQGAVGIERSFEPWNNANLLPVVLPALTGVVERLRAGVTVVDIGCGAGSAVLLMAAEFPASKFLGYDISQFALARAAEKLDESGLRNASFHDPRTSPIAADHSVDLVTTFDCIHDMTQPQRMMETIRAAIKPDGVWLLVDIKALDSFEENARKNPMAALMYGISVLSCMSSALSEPDGEGLGTLGLSESKARSMATAAGFTRFRRLDIDHAVNAFYEIRP